MLIIVVNFYELNGFFFFFLCFLDFYLDKDWYYIHR